MNEEDIDVIFVNKQLEIFKNVPAYTLLFLLIPIGGLLTFSVYMFAISIVLFYFFIKTAIFFAKENLSFLKFFSAIGFIYKPKYFLIKK